MEMTGMFLTLGIIVVAAGLAALAHGRGILSHQHLLILTTLLLLGLILITQAGEIATANGVSQESFWSGAFLNIGTELIGAYVVIVAWEIVRNWMGDNQNR